MRYFALFIPVTCLWASEAVLAKPTHSRRPNSDNDIVTCTPLRLDIPGASMAKAVVRNQGQDGTCYAAAAAQLIDAISGADHPPSSLLELAFGAHVQMIGLRTVRGGSICPLVKYANSTGSTCDTFDRQQVVNLGALKEISFTEYSSRLNAAWDRLEQTASTSMTIPSRGSIDEWMPIDWLTDRDNASLTSNCAPEQRHAVPKMICRSIPSELRSDFDKKKQIVHDALERGLPVGLGICRNFMDKNITFVPYQGKTSEAWNAYMTSAACRLHYVVGIGRRPFRNKCQVLVRNSYGGGCQAFRPEYQSSCEAPKGDVWVDEDKLLNYTFDMSLVEKR